MAASSLPTPAFDGKVGTLFVATSDDLRHWTKRGPAFASTPYAVRSSKSGSILTEMSGGRLVAARPKGRLWMYWGEGTCFAATSEDLVRRTPVEFGATTDRYLSYHPCAERPWDIHRRTGAARAPADPVSLAATVRLTACGARTPGPLAPRTGSSSSTTAPTTTSRGPLAGPLSYQPGQALFDANEPASRVARRFEPFLLPDTPDDQVGQVANVCFAQRLSSSTIGGTSTSAWPTRGSVVPRRPTGTPACPPRRSRGLDA